MKTFKDIQFHPHEYIPDAIHGTVNVKNMIVSVAQSSRHYSGTDTYEVAVMDDQMDDMYWLGENEQVRGWQSEDEIDALLVTMELSTESFKQRCLRHKTKHDEYMQTLQD